MSAKTSGFIDYAAVKKAFPIRAILEHYGYWSCLEEKKRGYRGLCPFCEKPSLSVSTEKNAWQCFACKRKGNVLDFVALQEQVSIHEAAHILEGLGAPTQAAHNPAENPPLGFELKHLKREHESLVWKKETLDYFGLGYCTKGLLQGRVAIPIHSRFGELLAYAGDKAGEYKYPKEFRKELELYNLHRTTGSKTLIVTDEILSVFELYEQGYKNVVSVMGSEISVEQALILRDLDPPRIGLYTSEANGINLLSRLVCSFYCKLRKK